ncbi:hypothetical protein ACP70R_045392 [Stipagrostis hirtigluma subsp. patula]
MVLGEQKKILLVLCLVTICCARAERNMKELKKQAMTHNEKQVAKAIQTEDGDIFDCVDIKSQPTFDHPVLRNHTIQIHSISNASREVFIQMEPTSFPTDVGNGSSTLQDTKFESTIRSVVSCPSGTVPIWRSGHEHPRVNLKELIQKISTRNMTQSLVQHNSVAGLSRGVDIYGTRVSISVYAPETWGTQDKNGGLTTIVNGNYYDKAQTNAVGAGWFVWQDAGGDKAARFHIFSANGDKQCWDFQCPGFVLTNSAIRIGGRLSPISRYKGMQYDLTTYIFRDLNGNWWLTVGANNGIVGYWPSSLFPTLKNKGTIGYWGGMVDGPTVRVRPPPMGSGHFASEGDGKAAYCRNIKVVTADNKAVIPWSFEFETIADRPRCYTVGNRASEKDGIYFNWGGPGQCIL